MAINTVILTGRVVRDPELKTTTSGVPVCSFCVAVDRPRSAGEENEADFFDCVAWRGAAEFITKYFVKGDPIGIDGRLQTRSWVSKDGTNRRTVEVLVKETHFLGGKRNADQKQQTAPAAIDYDEVDENLPF